MKNEKERDLYVEEGESRSMKQREDREERTKRKSMRKRNSVTSGEVSKLENEKESLKRDKKIHI